MEDVRKRKIVYAELRIRTVKGKKRTHSIINKKFLVIGETKEEMIELLGKEKQSHTKQTISRELSLKDGDTFNVIGMEIQTEHGYTNYKL